MKYLIIVILVGILFSAYSQHENANDLSHEATKLTIQKNSVSFESIYFMNKINYGRLLPISKNSGISVGAGFIFSVFGTTNLTLESSYITGGSKHFFETGLDIYLWKEEIEEIYDDDDVPRIIKIINNTGIYPILGYRFQATNGFLLKLKIGVYPLDGPIIFPMFALGYSF